MQAGDEEARVVRVPTLPQTWARYATESAAGEARDTERFGSRLWSVEYRREREPYPFCLIDNGPEGLP